MSRWFRSKLERRYWISAVIAVAAVFSTLGLASVFPLTGPFQALMALGFLTGMTLVATVVITHGFRSKPELLQIGVAIGLITILYMVFLRLAIPERSHLIEFGVLTVFVYGALLERVRNGARIPLPGILSIILVSAIGALDEVVQILIPSRVFDYEDILFNTLAATGTVCLIAVMRWISSWRTR